MGRERLNLRNPEPLPPSAAPEGKPLPQPLRADPQRPYGQKPETPQKTTRKRRQIRWSQCVSPINFQLSGKKMSFSFETFKLLPFSVFFVGIRFTRRLIIYPAIIHCSWKNSGRLGLFGLWSRLGSRRERAFFCLISWHRLPSGRMISGGSRKVLRLSLTSFRGILWTRCWSGVRSLIWEFMRSLRAMRRWSSTWIDLALLGLHTTAIPTTWKKSKTRTCIWRTWPSRRPRTSTTTNSVANGTCGSSNSSWCHALEPKRSRNHSRKSRN